MTDLRNSALPALWILSALIVAAPSVARANKFDLPPVLGQESGGSSATPAAEGGGAELPPALPGDGEAPPVVAVGEDEDDGGSLFDPFTMTLESRLTWQDDSAAGEVFSFRSSAELKGRANITETVGVLANVRLRGTWNEGTGFDASRDIRIDTQELAFTWAAQPGISVEAGRINVRSGVAGGFNPTDWSKANSLILADSLDVSDRREDRLGILTATVAADTPLGLILAGYRPPVEANRNTVWTDSDVVGLGLDRTNPDHAGFFRFTPDFGGNISTTVSALIQEGESGVGVEFSASPHDSVVLYAEAFAQRRQDIATRALSGIPAAAAAFGIDGGRSYNFQSAIGGTWSLPTFLVGNEDVTLSLEHHFNQAGLDRDGLDSLQRLAQGSPAAAGLVRKTAADLQEPLTRHEFFGRFSWTDFIDDADLSAIAIIEPYDGSGIAQITVEHPITLETIIGFRAATSWGGDSSAFGGNPVQTSVQLSLEFTL